MKRNLKSEKGAITLVVLIGMLFLTAFLMSMYIQIANRAQSSAETTKQIEERYNNLNEANTIYDNYFANTDIIPIYTKEQLAKVGSGEQVLINSKVYTFSTDGYYTIENDLDLGGVYDEETKIWSGEQWTPLTSEFTGILDGLGHTITGLYLGTSEGTQGIFHELNGTIKNLYIKDSYKITNMNGLLAGVNNGEIINCYYEKALIGLKVGDYVNYEPTKGTYTVAGGTYGTGYISNQSFTTDSSLKWRILSIDEKTGEIELVSATSVHTLYLNGADGYNHALDILNDLCEELYSNKNRATARSINVEDINAKTTYDYTTYNNGTFTYGDTKRLSDYGTGYMNYPKLYSQEKGYGTGDGTGDKEKVLFNTTGLEGSKGLEDEVTDGTTGITTYSTVTGSINGNKAGTDPYITYTFYYYSPESYLKELGINKAPPGLLKTGTTYWLASRCVYASSTDEYVCVRVVNSSGNVSSNNLFCSSGDVLSAGYAVCPVVSLGANVTLTKDTTNSTDTTTYWNIQY